MSKQYLIILTEVILAIVILGSMFAWVTKKPITSPKTLETQQEDSMADHHNPKPAQNNVFNSLLNQPAPDFSLTSFEGKTFKLSDFRGQKVALFFNEGLMCYPACWDQIAAFGKDANFAKANVVVWSINVDPKADWEKAVKQMPDLGRGTVLLDTGKTVSNTYGVLTLDSSMHRGQFPGHSYILIDEKGVVRFVWDDPQMAIRNKELLEQIAKL